MLSTHSSNQTSLKRCGTSLVVQWLRLHASNAETQIGSLVGKLKSHISHGATKKKSHSEELDSVLKREASGTHRSPFSNLETSLVQGYSRKNRFSPVTANCSSIPTPDSESWTDYILILELEGKNILKKTTGIC